ncbi:MAG: ABC transporter permease [Saprospiraceae bacterium]|nr:ABC transporter permease [Saprospiraceae bacterium]MDG1434792.1 ABC transporter permease [Saprospiraceae bacterium]MDG2419048.1 ABC transporter permease [Saprospiraceae bacterium]
MNNIKLAWKNLTNKPLNMMLSLVLFALGVGMISMIFLIENQVQEKFDKNLAGISLVIGAKGSPLQMILCNMYHVDDPTGNVKIKDVKPFLSGRNPLIDKAIPLSLGDSYKGFRIVGTTQDYPELYDVKTAKGKIWKDNFEANIGADVAKIANLKIGDTFYSTHGFLSDGMNGHEHGQFKVVGIFQKSNSVIDQLILTTTQSIWEVHDNHDHEEEALVEESTDNHEGHDHAEGDDHAHDHNHEGHDHAASQKPLIEEVDQEITSILIKFKESSKKSFQALTMLRGINENTEVMAASPAIELNRLYDNMSLGESFLRNLAMIIVFVSGLSIFISLFSSLRDRKYELALMRVMGATPTKLFFLIILEGLLLAVIGYVIGIILSHLGMSVFAGQMEDKYHYSFTAAKFLKEEFYLLGGALFIGFVAAVIPAYQAFRTDISQTLTES